MNSTSTHVLHESLEAFPPLGEEAAFLVLEYVGRGDPLFPLPAPRSP